MDTPLIHNWGGEVDWETVIRHSAATHCNPILVCLCLNYTGILITLLLRHGAEMELQDTCFCGRVVTIVKVFHIWDSGAKVLCTHNHMQQLWRRHWRNLCSIKLETKLVSIRCQSQSCSEHFCTVDCAASSLCQLVSNWRNKKSGSRVPTGRFWQRNGGAIPETLTAMMSSQTSLSKDSVLSMWSWNPQKAN